MNYRLTKHQVARGAFPDAQDGNKMYVFKNVRLLRATYQIKLLTFLASEKKMKVILRVPAEFTAHQSLKSLMKEFPRVLQIEKRA